RGVADEQVVFQDRDPREHVLGQHAAVLRIDDDHPLVDAVATLDLRRRIAVGVGRAVVLARSHRRATGVVARSGPTRARRAGAVAVTIVAAVAGRGTASVRGRPLSVVTAGR